MPKQNSAECPKCGQHMLLPMNDGSVFFDEDAFAAALVAKLQAALPAMLADLNGKTITIEHPALVKPIVITIHTQT